MKQDGTVSICISELRFESTSHKPPGMLTGGGAAVRATCHPTRSPVVEVWRLFSSVQQLYTPVCAFGCEL